MFKLFSNALDDFSAYRLMYISIRTRNWDKRTTSMKMMLERIVVSGAFTYQKLLTKHLASEVKVDL